MDAQERSKLKEALGPDCVQWLSDHKVFEPFAHLVEHHCGPRELWDGLTAIRPAWEVENPQRPEIRAQATGSGYPPAPEHEVVLVPKYSFEGHVGFDRSELRTVIRRMRQCADDLERLKLQSVRHILSEKYRFPPETPGWFPRVEDRPGRPGRPTLGDVLSQQEQLLGYAAEIPWRLRLLGLAVETVAEHVYLKGRPIYDSAVASLARYVRQATGQFHDEEVSALIGAVTERPNYDAVAHRDWRRRNHKLLG